MARTHDPPGKSVIATTARPERLEWLFNIQRARHTMASPRLALLGSGTSPDETFNAAINKWLRNCGEVHAETMRLRLSVRHSGSLMSHNSALGSPTLCQVRSHGLSAFVVHAQRWTSQEWCTHRRPDNVR